MKAWNPSRLERRTSKTAAIDVTVPPVLPIRFCSSSSLSSRLETVFRACSGADIENVLDVVQEHSGVANHLGLQVGPDIWGDDVTLVTHLDRRERCGLRQGAELLLQRGARLFPTSL